jgi:hypothetical protein
MAAAGDRPGVAIGRLLERVETPKILPTADKPGGEAALGTGFR